jgi:hypothetical protein
MTEPSPFIRVTEVVTLAASTLPRYGQRANLKPGLLTETC